jgi:hypothetical protein
MSFYSDASLVLIPSGYKDQKVYSAVPTDGSGDMSFSRASSATRVASNGLIEKVRTNLLLQSNTFSTTWDLGVITATGGQSGYDGSSNAWLLTKDANAFRAIEQSVTIGGIYTFSVYAKANTATNVHLRDLVNSAGATFNLTTGTISDMTASAASINSVGGGWYRCSVTVGTATTILGLYVDFSVATAGSIFIQNSQAELGDIATDYIATTTTAVSVGPVSGLPRLDYLNSTCPKLLLEPQRTNSWVNSENASSWVALDINTTSNSITSPDGNQSADTVTSNTTSSVHVIGSENISFTSGTTYSSSIFVKANTGRYVQLLGGGSSFDGNSYANFDLQTGTITFTGSSATAKIVSYGSGWYRCEISASAESTANDRFYFGVITTATAARGEVHTTALSYYVWGGQTETGAYATSYIPTLGTSVTRVADSAFKTSATSVIGQTEGVLYSEFVVNGFADFGTAICINNGTTSESIWLTLFAGGTLRAEVFTSSTVTATFILSGLSVGQTYKAAFGYAANNFAFFVNGVQVGTTDTSGAVPVGMNRVDFDYTLPSSFVQSAIAIKQALLFKTRLTNESLAALTSL